MSSVPVDVGRAFLRSLGNEAKALFDIQNGPLFDPAGFLADPDAPPASQQGAKALGRAICRSWANRQGDSNNPAADRLYGRACTPYLESISERPDDGELGAPFLGGQCSGVCYVVNVVNASGSNVSFQARGPIGGVRGVTIPGGGRLEVFSTSEPVNPINNNCTALGSPGWRFTGVGGSSWNADSRPRITSIAVKGGGDPTACGDPPPEYRPPRPITIVAPIVPVIVNLPGIGEVNVNVEVFPDANISLCSEDVDVCVEIGRPGDGDGDGGGGGGGGDGGPGSPGSPSDTGRGGDAEGEAPEGQILTGLKIDFVEPPIGGNEYAPGVFRGVCYIYMGTPDGLDHDPAGAMLRNGQFVYAEKDYLTRWAVSANTGYNLRVTPYYRPAEAEG